MLSMTRTHLLALVVACAVCLVGLNPAAAQQDTTVYENGPWLVTRSSSAPSCTLMVKPTGVTNGFYNIQYRTGLDFVLSSAWKENWRIPKDTKTNVTLVIDRATIGTFDALDFNPRALGWGFKLSEWRTTVANLLMNGVQARVVFHGGNEVEWNLNLSGSTTAVGAFVACANAIGGDLSPMAGR
jgi:hypothetical protein